MSLIIVLYRSINCYFIEQRFGVVLRTTTVANRRKRGDYESFGPRQEIEELSRQTARQLGLQGSSKAAKLKKI